MRTHSTIRPVLVHDKNCLDVSALSSELHQLCRTVPWRSFLAIAGDWLFIAAAIVAARLAHHWLAALCALVVIGSRQHALLILMHDASHFRIHPRKKINDVLANCFLAWPCFISVEAYRAHHYEHHVHVNTDEDPDWLRKKDNPDWAFPKKQWHILLIFLRAALYTEAGEIVKALIFRPFLRKRQPTAAEGGEAKGTAAKPPKSRLKLAYYLSLVAILTAFGWWSNFLFYWMLPLLTFNALFLRMRSVCEHFGLYERSHDLNHTRNYHPSLLERIFIAPHNVHYHLDHHLFPAIPFYHLPRAHRLLMALPDYRENSHQSVSIFTDRQRSVLCDLTGGTRVAAEQEKPVLVAAMN